METRKIAEFQKTVWNFYEARGRHGLPWRLPEADGSFDPYKILVSEVMLQQTQVPRVLPKYEEFLAKFPDVGSLARTKLGDVLAVWGGLGYNRRAKFLWQAAQKIEQDFAGIFPQEAAELQKLPGIGSNTAGAIIAYSFNWPEIFIETNIRTVFIHHFFEDKKGVSDKEIVELVEKTIDKSEPRLWFWALMDYGSFLKQTVGNLNKASKSYAKQSKFKGSRRQLRGEIIRQLLAEPAGKTGFTISDERLEAVLTELVREGLIEQHSKIYSISR
ncbi:MAG TPA: hypothetical protein VGG13_02720 [Candidatus Saccharimonadales bacterium]|jgi:A/G-specific adenine glycosylase